MKITAQEQNVIQFLSDRDEVFWEELAQFCKDPANVKLRTVQKIVSDIRKKFRDMNRACPFDCRFGHLNDTTFKQADEPPKETVVHNGQTLTKLVRASVVQKESIIPAAPTETRKPHQIDFSIKKWQNQIVSKTGIYNLSSEDFEVFEYLYNNHEKIITLEELRDKVVFPLYGSKLPPRWWDSIQRRINNVRRAVPELKNRIFTVKTENNGTGYFFK